MNLERVHFKEIGATKKEREADIRKFILRGESGVAVVASQAPPYYDFKNWSGDASGRSYTTTVTMDSNKSVMAHFAKINPPLNFSAQKVHNYSFSQDEYINVLTQQANPVNEYIQKYRLYQVEGGGRSLLAEFDNMTFQYWHRNGEKDKQYIYALASVNDRNREGEPASISVQ